MITKDLEHMRPLKGDELLPRDSEYLGADDIDPNVEPILTIKNIYRGKVTLSRGKEVKNVLTFVEETAPGVIGEVRPMILNSTNRQVLKKLYGQVTANALEGKKIQLWIEHGVRNPAKNELTDGIRIRDKKPVAGKEYKAPKCTVCGKDIVGVSGLSPDQVAKMTKEKYGKMMCSACAAKMKAEKDAAEQTTVKAEEVVAAVNTQDDLAAQLQAAAEE